MPPLLAWTGAAGDEAATLGGALSAQVVDAIHGAPDLLAFGADAAVLDRIETLSAQVEVLDRRQARANAVATLLTQLCLGAALVAVLAVGVDAVHAHHLNPVMVAVLPLAALGTFEPMPGVAQAAARARAVSAAARRLLDLEAVPVPVTDPVDAERLPGGVPPVSFSHASLRYAPDRPRAFDDVTLRLEPGAAWRSPVRAAPGSRAWSARSFGSGPSRRERSPWGTSPWPACPNQMSGPPARWSTRGPSSSPERCAPT